MFLKEFHRVGGLIVFLFCSSVICHIRPNIAQMVSPELKELRKRWGAADIVRDLEHIKEDVKKITRLQDNGELSTQEALFYFLRMHDFDDNGNLDGHELLAAMTHAIDHSSDAGMPFEEKESIVDGFFAYDDNGDGFVSYPELRKHLAPDAGSQQ